MSALGRGLLEGFGGAMAGAEEFIQQDRQRREVRSLEEWRQQKQDERRAEDRAWAIEDRDYEAKQDALEYGRDVGDKLSAEEREAKRQDERDEKAHKRAMELEQLKEGRTKDGSLAANVRERYDAKFERGIMNSIPDSIRNSNAARRYLGKAESLDDIRFALKKALESGAGGPETGRIEQIISAIDQYQQDAIDFDDKDMLSDYVTDLLRGLDEEPSSPTQRRNRDGWSISIDKG